MSRMKKGNGLLRFLIFAVLSALVLTGCNGTRKYEAVDLSSETAAVSETAESDTASAENETDSTDSGASGSGDVDVRALGEPAGEAVTADPESGDPASERSESASESEELSSEMSEAESVEAARESAAAAYTAAANDDAETAPEIPFNGHTVAIDAGHQAKADTSKEPIGPSSTTMKAKMPEGAVGTTSGVHEYEVTLTVAKKLETELVNRGYHVVMIRTSHDVNMSSAERSAAANRSGADILIRVHAGSMDNSGVYGALSTCMTAQNPYNAGLHDKSYNLSKKIVDTVCGTTGTKNRGVQETDSSSDINWCEIPVCVFEMGFLSNPDEDTWLQDDGYQGKIASGIAGAVDAYFAEGN